jgi:deoxyribodipyrimidine photo-lyase
VVPVFILDPVIEESYGRAPLWRLGLSIEALGRDIEACGSRLILRRGVALSTLRGLIAETGARRVVWSRLYDRRSIARDREIKAALSGEGVEVRSVSSSLLHEPWTVETGQGGPYKVYTPYWRAVRGRDVAEPLAEPGDLAPPGEWPASDTLADWRMADGMGRGAGVVRPHLAVGEAAARERLDRFLDERIARYATDRDRPDLDATSRLSENLTTGEISPRTVWHAGAAAMERLEGDGEKSAETFLSEIVWREFSYHLLFHFPHLESANYKPGWDAFPWRDDNEDAERWRRGLTGFELVDAGMRELYVTGTMHNRVRMLTGSVLTKHFLTHWKVGEAWFRDCLVDWDIASNSMGWQWVAGSGPDATPYFRIFNPITQAQKFDPDANYRIRFLGEMCQPSQGEARAFFDAVPPSWGMSPDDAYPAPSIEHAEGRRRALEAYETIKG